MAISVRPMASTIGFLCMMVVSGPVQAKPAPLKVHSITATRPDLGDVGQFRFPRVSGAPGARSINVWLQASELSRFPGAHDKTPFDAVWPKPGEWHGVVSLDYQTNANTAGYFSVTVSGEYDGAYPSLFTNRYNFDVHGGKPIALEDLLSADGLKTFRDRERKRRMALLDGVLKPADPDDVLPEDQEEAQHDAYAMCRRMLADGDTELSSYELSDQALTVLWGCEFPHAIQALDDLGEQRERYPFAALKPLLSDYGRCLLIDQGADCVPPPKAEGVYYGRIDGRYPITLMLGGQWAEATYAYDRVGTPIQLSRKGEGHHYVLVHRSDSDKSETFDLTLDHGMLSGTWRQGGGPTRPVTLSAMPGR